MLKAKPINSNSIMIKSYLDKVIGRKVEGQPQPKMTVNGVRFPNHADSEYFEFLMASKANPSQLITPTKAKKKKKKKSKKNTQNVLKSQSKYTNKKQSIQVFPWGVNQERLKNYILAEQEKYFNAIQRRNTRAAVEQHQKRLSFGTSFFNQLAQKNAKSFIKKKKSSTEENQQSRLTIFANLHQKCKHFGNKPKDLILHNKQKMNTQHYPSPAAKISKRNRSLSQGQHNKSLIKNKIRTASLHENRGYDRGKEREKIKKCQQPRKIIVQYQQQLNNNKCKNDIQIMSKNDSMRQPHSSLYKMMSNSSSNNMANESDPEQQIDDLDDSFYSQKIKLDSQQDEIANQQEHIIKKLKESSEKKKIKSAIIIQKYWRGATIRKNLNNLFNQEAELKNEEEINGFDLNTLSKSQIEELIKLKYIERDSSDNLKKIDESSIVSQSRPISQNESHNPVKEQKRQTENIQYQNFMENFQEEKLPDSTIHQQLSLTEQLSLYRNKEQQLRILQEQTPEKSKKCQQLFDEEQQLSSQQQRSRKINFLSIDVEEQEEENKVDIGEIRCAFGSESLLKSLSQEGDSSFTQEKCLFDQGSFQDFVMVKFKELMQRDKMDQLIQLREEIMQQRQQQTQKSIDKAFQSNQISPRTFEIQQQRLEKWVTKQKIDLEQKKREILRGQQSAYEAIIKTQRDMTFVKQISQQQNSQAYIKIIDSLSQESANYSESSLKNSVIDIQQQITREEKLEAKDDFYVKQKWSDNILEEKEMICPEYNLSKFAQSQVVRSIDSSSVKVSEKCADSYTILISNMLIQEEVKSFYLEMQNVGIDLYEVISKSHTANLQNSQIHKPKLKGMKTSVIQVKQYLKYLEDYLIDHSMILIQRAINFPLGPSSKLMLKFLQPMRDSLESDFDSSGAQHSIILSAELFGKFEKFLIEQQLINNSSKLLVELEHIHNKVIYDSLNEALDQFRPYGLIGQPFSWKPDPVRLKFRDKQLTEIPEIIRKASEKVVEWSHYMAGLIVDKEDSPFPKALLLDQDALGQIREDRLFRMLTLDVIDNEERWTNYDEETTEISIDISDLIFDQLIDETLLEIKKPY